jgi:hypothetical protein
METSWCEMTFRSQDPEVVKKVSELMGVQDGPYGQIDNAGLEWTIVQGETSYGLAEEAEAYLTSNEIPWSRCSDGKYDYDGDEAHWTPGMDAPRGFTRLNNGGRCLTEQDVKEFRERTAVPARMETYARIHERLAGSALVPAFLEIQEDAELGAFVREAFAFEIGEVINWTPDTPTRRL